MRKNGALPAESAIRLELYSMVFLLIFAFLTPCLSGENRAYQIRSAEEVEYARKSVLSQLAPLLPTVLEEAGLQIDAAIAFCQRFEDRLVVEGRNSQIERNYKHSLQILDALPGSVRNQYLRISYQWVGPPTFWRDEVAASLALSKDQQNRVREILIDFLERLAPANRSDFFYGMTAGQFAVYARRTAEIAAERDGQLLALLTSDQRKSWEALIGKPSAALKDFRGYCTAADSQ